MRIIFRLPAWIVDFFEMVMFYVISRFYKNKKEFKDVWLISDTGTEANDNGYHFFKYLNENHKEVNSIFIISKDKPLHYNKVKDIGKIVEYGSAMHKIYFFLAHIYISPHPFFLQPWSYKLYKKLFDRKNKQKMVFLQHGIIKDDMSNLLSKDKTLFDLFITSTEKEYKSIANTYDYKYKDNEVVLTGLARYDNLLNFETKRQILVMPSWRNNFVRLGLAKDIWITEDDFIKTNYYKHWQSLIASKKLMQILDDNRIELLFYPHYKLQRYIHLFNAPNDIVKILSTESSDVQTLLKESKLLITDFSSIYFDFAYMKKPLIYYMFDTPHYNKGYFDYSRDGFGDIIKNEDKLIDKIEFYINNSFTMEDKYINRVDDNFTFRDTNNSERIYNAIIKKFY